MRRTTVVFALACLVGCGGSVSADDTDGGGVVGDSSTGGSDTSTLGDGVVPKDGTSSDGTVIDGGAKDTTTPGDTNPGDAAISCGTSSCDPTTQECCVEFTGGAVTTKCIDKGGTCGGGTLDCTSSAACPSGDVCCGTRDPTGGFSATCTTSAACTGPGTAQLCGSDADCPAGDRCRTVFGGLKICRAPFDGGGFDASGFDTSGFDTAGFGG